MRMCIVTRMKTFIYLFLFREVYLILLLNKSMSSVRNDGGRKE